MTVGELLTVKELAEWLKVPRSWVYERTRRRGRDQISRTVLSQDIGEVRHGFRMNMCVEPSVM